MKKLILTIGLIGTPILILPSIIPIVPNQIKIPEKYNDDLAQSTDYAYIESQILARENRSYQHSFFTPTGYFLEQGQTYNIKFNHSANTNDLAYLVIGQYRSYQGLNNGKDVGFETWRIGSDNLTITPKNSGMVYLKDYHFTNSFKIMTISNNPIKVPTFIIDETNQTDFFNEIATTKSFFIEVVAKHVFGTFQTQMIRNQVMPVVGVNINENLHAWDQVWKDTNEVYGLNETYSGVAKKYPQFIHIINPDDSGSSYAFTNNYYLAFHNHFNAGRDLFLRKPNNMWGLWHEIGHTYQTPQYTWTNLVEVTVNISALYTQKKITGGDTNVDSASNIAKVKAFLNTTTVGKDYNQQSDLFVKLTMFWQLQMAFGTNFYPSLSQHYRTDNLNVGDKQQDFVKNTAKLANRNLIPFFEKWGIKMTDATKTVVAQLPSLKSNIWENVINGTHNPVIEWEIPKYQVSSLQSEIKAQKIIDFGTTIDKNNLKNNFIISESKKLQYQVNFDWLTIIIKDGKYYVPVRIIVNDGVALRNDYCFLVQVSFDNTISLVGYAYYQRGIIGLDRENQKFYFAGSTTGLDVTQKPNVYYTITIKNQYGTIIKQVDIKGEDNMRNAINQNGLSNIAYQEGYTLEIDNRIINKVRLFNTTSNSWADNQSNYTKYRIVNNRFIQI